MQVLAGGDKPARPGAPGAPGAGTMPRTGGWPCMKPTLLIAALVAMLAAAGWLAVEGWMLHDEVELPPTAYLAMALGVVFSLVVGVGLMALVFYSSRKGYDEPAEREQRDGELP